MISRKQMFNALWATLLLVATAICGISGGAVSGESLVIGSGGVAGMYYPAAGSIAALINRKNADSGILCAVVPSLRASSDNVLGVANGTLQLGLVQSDVQYNAINGVGVYEKSGPVTELRSLFSLYSEAFTVMLRSDSGIGSFRELAGKRVSMGNPGASYRVTTEMLLREYGLDVNSLTPVEGVSPEDGPAALVDGRIDAFVYIIGHPYVPVREGLKGGALRLLTIADPETQQFMAKHPYYPEARIPASIYMTSSEIKTFGPKAVLTANANLPEATAYLLVKTVFENLDEFKKMYPALATLEKQEMITGVSAPFHPGAIRYFKEVGLMR